VLPACHLTMTSQAAGARASARTWAFACHVSCGFSKKTNISVLMPAGNTRSPRLRLHRLICKMCGM
jgi:hypothetical protein